MPIGEGLLQLGVLALIALSAGGAAFALLYPWFSGEAAASKRVANVVGRSAPAAARSSFRAKLFDDPKDSRRRQIQESLAQFEEREKKRKKRPSVRAMIAQAGLEISLRAFWVISVILGLVLAAGAYIVGAPWFVAVAAGAVGAVGLPRWCLSLLRRRRQNVFLNDFADAVDVMVRGLKAGLPVTDAFKVIASEFAPPVGPEISEVVEGQRVGISLDQGIERMYERIPLPEVNFLSIVMTIQQKTGGNLAEALNNLSKVLRDRKKMKAKIRAVSQEAKASAMIIGSLPFIILGGLTILNPEYLSPLFETKLGNVMLAGSAMWMLTGCLVMRKMINFDF